MCPFVKKLTLLLVMVLCIFSNLLAEEFYIIYTANVNGMIENCGCGADPLGGIGRVKSFIDQFKGDHRNVIVIDGGDYFNTYPFPKLNEAMYSSLLLLQYDCLVPGDQAFVEGDSFFSKYASTLQNKIILSNSGAGVKTKLTKNFGSNKIMIFGYLSPYIFEFIEKPIQLNLSNFVDARPEPAKKNEFQVAVIHGYLSNAEQFAVENPTVNLILLAHDQRKGVWKKNQATIIGNGKDSEYISVVTISPESQWDISIEQNKIHEDLPEDDQIVKIIEEYKTN
jgi:2',3'-cyclic-nucleotide 2'-phosphodiesterase (5'-nucleotidase family)